MVFIKGVFNFRIILEICDNVSLYFIFTQVQEDQKELLEKFFNLNHYIRGSYESEEDFKRLDKHIKKFEKGSQQANRLFYLALPPTVYQEVATNIHSHCMATGWVLW